MKRYLPTYDDCLELCRYDNSPFYESIEYIDGYKISIFNYRLALYEDFKNPPISKDIDAFELRGLTFVFNKDGSLYNRYILLNKFFNINQTEDSLYDNVKDLKIDSVFNKEDGSLATFIKLPNNRIVGKTKMGFNNIMSVNINNIYSENEDIKKLVDFSLDNNIIPIFEYVSPFNKIVLDYDETDLVLLKLRNNLTGEYLNIDDYPEYNISRAERFNYSLDEMLELAQTRKDIEGWIVSFENGFMLKIKTKWYFDQHHLLTEEISLENRIIKFILDETIDDVISKIDSIEVVSYLNDITKLIRLYISYLENSIKESFDKFKSLNISRKEYVLTTDDINRNFVLAMIDREELLLLTESEIIEIYDNFDYYYKSIESKTPYNLAVNYIRINTNKQKKAQKFLMNIKKLLSL